MSTAGGWGKQAIGAGRVRSGQMAQRAPVERSAGRSEVRVGARGKRACWWRSGGDDVGRWASTHPPAQHAFAQAHPTTLSCHFHWSSSAGGRLWSKEEIRPERSQTRSKGRDASTQIMTFPVMVKQYQGRKDSSRQLLLYVSIQTATAGSDRLWPRAATHGETGRLRGSPPALILGRRASSSPPDLLPCRRFSHRCGVEETRLDDAATASALMMYVLAFLPSFFTDAPPLSAACAARGRRVRPPTTERVMTGHGRIYINRCGRVLLLIETLHCCTSF